MTLQKNLEDALGSIVKYYKGKDSPINAENLSEAFSFAFPNSQARDKAKDMFKSVINFSTAMKTRRSELNVKIEGHEET